MQTRPEIPDEMLAGITPRQRAVLKLRLGQALTPQELQKVLPAMRDQATIARTRSLREIAVLFGLSKERIRQIENRVYEKLAALPPSRPAESVEDRFHRLAAVWHRDTAYLSCMEEAERHPAYQEIIGLGAEVVPLLLRDLAENHTHWFAALEAITGARPVPASAAGNIPKMADAWLGWAKDNGYLS